MATGIEMLGQMGTDQSLAGPVQGGNMVVKPNQVPVGGAAMLAKALRGQANKGVGGMYVLPEQEESMPGFMQMAQQNVNEDMTRMARTVEAEAPPGHMLSYITPEEAGILKLLGGTGDINPVTGIPQFKKRTREERKADNIKAETARRAAAGDTSDYVRRQMGGSSNRRPGGGAATAEVGKQYERDVAEVGVEKAQERFMDRGREAQKDPRQFASIDYFGEEEVSQEGREERIKQEDKVDRLKDELKKAQDGGDQEEINRLENLIKTESTFLEKIMKDIADRDEKIMEEGSLLDKSGVVKDKLVDQLKKLGIMGPEIRAIENLPENTQKEMFKLLGDFKRLEVSPKEAMNYLGTTFKGLTAGLERKDKDGNVIGDTLEGLTKKLRALDTEGGASVLETLRKYAPEKHFKAFREPQTMGGLESFAKNPLAVKDAEGNYKVDGREISKEDAKRYNNAIFEARDKSRGGGNQAGFGRPAFMDAVEEEVIETPTGVVDEEAQTMAYTSPRTGGVETQVPLQRRFTTDPTQATAQYTTTPRTQEEIYKYMTEGTTGEGIGLEPFSEYQKRRRKALGYEPLGLWS